MGGMWSGRVLVLLLAVGGVLLQEEEEGGNPVKLGKVKAPVARTPKTVLEVGECLLPIKDQRCGFGLDRIQVFNTSGSVCQRIK